MKRVLMLSFSLLALWSFGSVHAAVDDGGEADTRGAASVNTISPTWTTGTAMIAPEGRWEFGLFHPLHWALSERVELSTHPLLTFLMPHINAKVLWYAHEGLYISTRHGLTYPSLLLSLLAKEGALGLLPPPREVPQGIIIDTDVLLTYTLTQGHWATLELGLQCAPRGGGDMPVFDFPFLYPYFGVLHGALGFEGRLWQQLGYRAEGDVWWIPAIEGGYAFEHTLALTWYFNAHVALTAGYRMSLARYPAGEQFHVLPYGDVLFAF